MVNLILYPNPGANTFVSLIDADSLAEQFLWYNTWSTLVDDEKSRYLIQAYRRILALPGISLPVAPEECINSAQVEIALWDNYNKISVTSSSTGEIKSAKVGPISVTYDVEGPTKVDVEEIPDNAMWCLSSSYGANISSGVNINLERS
jgi:hypothetical protein